MTNNADFREKFYKRYFEHQAARSGSVDVKRKALADVRFYAMEVSPHLPKEKEAAILELGCGYGSMLHFLKEQGYNNVKGIDVSQDQANAAKQLGVDVIVADLRDWLQTTTEQFDMIIAFDLIEHFDKPVLVDLLALINSKLKPGGRVIYRTPTIDAPMGSTYAYGDFTHGVVLNSHSAEQLMLATGSKEVRVLPSHIEVEGGLKEMIRMFVWWRIKFRLKLKLFATGKSTKGVVFTPNLIIVGSV